MVYTHNLCWAVLFRAAVWDNNTAGPHQHDAGLELASPASREPKQHQLSAVPPGLPVLYPAAMPQSVPHPSTWAGTFQG